MVIRFINRPPVRRLKSATTATTLSAVRSPGTTLRINRLSASMATWSQVSPLRSSAGSLGSQFFSFLATNAHFSSNWTSRVRGGKSDQLVVEVAGVLAGDLAQAADGASVHLAGAGRSGGRRTSRRCAPGPTRPSWRQAGVEQGRPLPLGESGLAGPAAEHASLLVCAVSTGHGEISGPPLAMLGAVGIQAAEASEVVHGVAPPVRSSKRDPSCVIPHEYANGVEQCNRARLRGEFTLLN